MRKLISFIRRLDARLHLIVEGMCLATMELRDIGKNSFSLRLHALSAVVIMVTALPFIFEYGILQVSFLTRVLGIACFIECIRDLIGEWQDVVAFEHPERNLKPHRKSVWEIRVLKTFWFGALLVAVGLFMISPRTVPYISLAIGTILVILFQIAAACLGRARYIHLKVPGKSSRARSSSRTSPSLARRP